MGIVSGTETAVSFLGSMQRNPEIVTLSDGGWVVVWTSTGGDGSNWGVFQRPYNSDGSPRTGENQVNTYTAGNQYDPHVAALSDGGWVVTWNSMTQDGDDSGIYQQVFNASAVPQSAEVHVSTATAGAQANNLVTALSNGGWVVTWTSAAQDSDLLGVYQQAYNADMSPLGGETLINSYTAGNQKTQQVTALDDGGWVVTWISETQDPGGSSGIYRQAYDASGSPDGGESRVNEFVTGSQNSARITTLEGGGYVVSWVSTGQDAGNEGVYQRLYDALGVAQTGEMLVNTTETGIQNQNRVTALSDGGWVVTWQSADGSDEGLFQQAYDADGTARGVQTQINTYTDNAQNSAKITGLADGGWVVTWISYVQDGSAYGVYARAFAADGRALSGEVQVNTYTSGDEYNQNVTALADGGFVVTWQSANQDGIAWSVHQKVFHFANSAPALAIDIPDQAASEDVAFSFQIPDGSFTDADSGDTLTYTATLASGDALPAWLSFDADTHTFSGTPANGDVATVTVKVTVSDGLASISDTFDIAVGNVNDAPQGADKTVTIAEDQTYTFTASDFGFSDIEGNGFASVIVTTLASHGTLLLDGAKVLAGQQIVVADIDGLTWKPAKDANGTDYGSFTFQVVDDGGTAGSGQDTDPLANTFHFDVTEVVDSFIGTRAANKLTGTSGADYFRGKAGNDILAGKAGGDTFDFRRGDDHDTITDFRATGPLHDILDFSHLPTITSFKDLMAHHAETKGRDVVIDGLGGDEILLKHVRIADLDAQDFQF